MVPSSSGWCATSASVASPVDEYASARNRFEHLETWFLTVPSATPIESLLQPADLIWRQRRDALGSLLSGQVEIFQRDIESAQESEANRGGRQHGSRSFPPYKFYY